MKWHQSIRDVPNRVLRRFLCGLAALVLGTAVAGAGELRLLMFEEAGCPWCARWNAEIGPAYPNSWEGRRAPLQRLDIHQPLPASLLLDSRPRFTPTFVLVDDGREVGRIEGYPGPDFFWPLLDALFERLEPSADPAPTPTN